MSIQRLLSLRAARRRREQHFTSRRPGRTTAGWLACALALPALLALALAWSLLPLVHDDLFWHLRTGEWIAAHHRVPLVDLFSYTRYGARWITHEWGFSLLSFLVFRAAGAGGLVLLTSALALGIFAAVAWRALDLAGAPAGAPWPAGRPRRRPAPAGRAPGPARCLLLAALLALGMWAASPEIFLRAALAGELMLALALAALTRYRRTGRRRWLVGVAALFWLWANLHSGVVFGLGVLALYALEPFLAPARGGPAGGRRASRRCRRAAPYLWTLAAAAVLTLLNPNGVDAPLYPFLLARILFASGIPWELGHFAATAPTGDGAGAALWLLVALLLLGLLPVRQARRVSPAEGASIAIFLLATLVSRRFVFDFVVIALPTLYQLLALPPLPAPAAAQAARLPLRSTAASLPRPAPRPPSSPPHPPPAACGDLPAGRALAASLVALVLLPVAPAAVAAAAAAWARRPPAAGGLIAEPLPQAAARFVAAAGHRRSRRPHLQPSELRRLPRLAPARAGVLGRPQRRLRRAGARGRHPARSAPPPAATAVGYLVLAEHDYPGIRPEIAAGRWGLVYWDDFCAVYLRRGPRYAALLRRLELRLFPPFGGRPGLARPGRRAARRRRRPRRAGAGARRQSRQPARPLLLGHDQPLPRRSPPRRRRAAGRPPHPPLRPGGAVLDRLRRLPPPPAPAAAPRETRQRPAPVAPPARPPKAWPPCGIFVGPLRDRQEREC